MANIIWLSDMDMKGSGYFGITTALCTRLAALGHVIKIVGLGYMNDEHGFPFSIIPCRDFQEMEVMVHNLQKIWEPDIIIGALDIPWHEKALAKVTRESKKLPYIGIFPVESGPLCMDWAFTLMAMSAQFCISQFGTDECRKMNVPAEHLQVGVDTASFRPPTKEERASLREAFGITEDTFTILTVADNQERKNLGRTFEIIGQFKKWYGKPVCYNLVTREDFAFGFKLRSLAAREDIQIADILRIYERGIDFKKLWALYAASDAFVLFSRAEGLGMPVLEAMAVKIPVVGTGACAILEHLKDNRGIPTHPEAHYPDVFGNGERYMVGINEGAHNLLWLTENEFNPEPALEYVSKRTWDIPTSQINDKIEELTNGKKKQK